MKNEDQKGPPASKTMTKILYKQLAVAFLAVFILISSICVHIAGAQDTALEIVHLTTEESAWLAEHGEITVGHIPGWPPYSFLDSSGRPVGSSMDFFELVARKAGLRYKMVVDEWSVIYPKAQKKEIDVLTSMAIKPDREEWFLFPRPYADQPAYIVTRKGDTRIRRPEDLKGKIISQAKDTWYVEEIRNNFPSATLSLVSHPEHALMEVSSGDADATLAATGIALYAIAEKGLFNLHLAWLYSDEGDRITFSVRNDYPELASIIDKSIAAITETERVSILNRWMPSAEPRKKVKFTDDEQAWLAAHPDIALGASTTYPPFVIKRDDGTYEGVLVDYLEAASRLLGQRIRLHIEDPWIKVQERAEKREIDGLALGGKSSDRAVLYLATDTLFDTYFSIFGLAKDEHPIRRFTDLDGKRIGHKVGAKPTIELLQKLPNAILIPYNDNEELSQALLSKEVEFVGDWITFDFFRKRTLQGMIDNIYLIDEYPMVMVSHIRKDWPEFVSIMNKVIAAMRQDELPRIMDKWFIDWPQQASTTSIQLTPEERAWLDQTPTVRVRIVDYPPYQMVEGNLPPQGITIEYLKLIGGRAGIEFKYEVTDQPFAEFLESMKQGKGPDMTALIARTPKREQYLSFTEPYLSSPYVIFIRQDDSPILDIQGLLGKTVAIPRGFVVQEQLESNYPGIKLTLVDSDEKALQAVATGQADAYIGSLTVASHIIHQKGLSHLKVTAAAPFANQTLSMGIRNDIPQLSSIIEKALASITAEERTTIRNKYLSIIFEQGIDKAEVLKWVLIFGGSALGILLTVLLWNRQMSREIRRRKQTELALKQAKSEAEAANQAKSSFLANVSHELRTPLNAILGFSRLLAREQNATPSQQEKLAIINRSGEHLLAMINDVLDLSKIEAGRIESEPKVFELPQLLGDVGRMFEVRAERHGLRFERSLDPGLARYVKADAGKLRQILINLLNNAVKFTAQGGIVLRARSAPVPGDPAMVGLQLEVEDSGCGMSPERQERIFEPFVQAEPTQAGTKGTGLGLAISKSFVALMGGQISVDSTLGEGSLFRVELPVALAEAAEAVDVESVRPAVLGLAPGQPAWRILVVEDNLESRLLLSSLLREAGFEIREAENGAEAIDRFQQWQPHLIWMDMRMPVLDGYEAIPKIRKLAGGDAVKIVAITASAFKEQRPDILAAGCDEVVLKPFRAHEIFDTMARLLDIQYLYEEEGEEAPRKETIHLTAEMLAGLPEELLDELRESSQALNSEAALEVISRLAQQAPEVASALRKLVDHYQFDELQDLLGVSRNSHA